MPRRVQDIIPGNRRSIRDIPLNRSTERTPTQRRSRESEKDEEVIKIHRSHDQEQVDSSKTEVPKFVLSTKEEKKRPSRKKNSPWIITVLGLVVVFAGIAFAVSGHFANATFTLVPKVIPVKIGGTYIIPPASTGTFGYVTTTFSGTATTTVPATIGSYIETKAQGKITIYNTYSTKSQRLIAGTRLASTNGLVYRLTGSVTVPGYTKSGSTIVPGHITTTMSADKAGNEYNISSSDSISDFKIIAFKGTDRYDHFYGRLASSITGGFAGKPTIVSKTVLASTSADVEEGLEKKLAHDMLHAVPDGYVMYPNGYISSSDAPVVSTVDSSHAQISVRTTITGLLFKQTDFARYLSGASSTDAFGTLGYTATGINSLSFAIANAKDFSPMNKDNLAVRLNGSFDLVGSIPTSTIQKAVVGVSLAQTKDILSKYVSVIDLTKSSGEINPPWVSTVPKDISHVHVVVKMP